MNVVLIHIGASGPFIDSTEPPDCLGDCVEQYSIFNDDKIYVLTDRKNIAKIAKYPQVIPVTIEDYHSRKIAQLCSLCKYHEKSFWTVSMTRFIYLENFMWANGLQHVYHFENDVLIYFDIARFHHVFKQLYHNIALTPGGPMKNMTGFMYITNHRALGHMTDFFISILAGLWPAGICKKYNCIQAHEMALMAIYNMEKGSDRMAYLPTLPFGEFSQNFDKFNAIFDPAGWGQFVGGTRTEAPGAKPPDHYIGQLLIENPQYGVDWGIKDGLRVPYFNYNGTLVKINNLHIHSKNLKPFMSKARRMYGG